MECSGRDSVRTISGRIVGQPEAIRSCCLAVVPQERVKTGAFRHISGRVANVEAYLLSRLKAAKLVAPKH